MHHQHMSRMDGNDAGARSNVREGTDSNDSISKSTSIASRLDRLETEINLLLMLSTKQKRPAEKSNAAKSKEKANKTRGRRAPREFVACPEKCVVPERDVSGEAVVESPPSVMPAQPTENASKCNVCNQLPAADDPADDQLTQQKRLKAKHRPEEKNEAHFHGDKRIRMRKKKSVCRCRRKRSSGQLNLKPPTPPETPRQQWRALRSKSADPKHFIASKPLEVEDDDDDECFASHERPRMKALSRSCPGSAEDVRELCELVVDLDKRNAMAKTLSDEWKAKCLDCASLKGLQAQTDAQRRFLGVCFQTEMRHRQLREKYVGMPEAACPACRSGEDQLARVQRSLQMQRSRNDDLLAVCEELQQELVMSEERLKQLAVAARAETAAGAPSVPKQQQEEATRLGEFQQRIREHLSEIEELRTACAKNAEWACEESSLRSQLMAENRSLQEKVLHTRAREQKQADHISILTKALLKVGKDNPKVKRLIAALQTPNWTLKHDIHTSVGVNVVTAPEAASGEAHVLVRELNTIIEVQRHRIQELVDMTATLTADGQHCAEGAISREQVKALQMARQEVEQVRERYVALETSMRNLHNSIKRSRAELAAEHKSKECLQDEVARLREQLEESNTQMALQVQTIEGMKTEMVHKDELIVDLKRDLNSIKEEKNALNKQIKAMEKLKEANEKLHIDVIRLQSIIGNLKKKCQLQKHEQILHQLAIGRAKEQALSAAQFATDKLMDTMKDFRRQSDSQSKVRHVLTKLLQDKDEKLRATIGKVSAMTLDPQQGVDATKVVRLDDQRMLPDSSVDVYYSATDTVVAPPSNTMLPVEHLVEAQSQFANLLELSGHADESYVEDASEQYETPQLFTLHEVEEDG